MEHIPDPLDNYDARSSAQDMVLESPEPSYPQPQPPPPPSQPSPPPPPPPPPSTDTEPPPTITSRQTTASASVAPSLSPPPNIVYATNISPDVTLEQITELFNFIGDIVDIAMFYFEPSPEANFKVCFVEFLQHSSVLMAQHLTNTILIDRALIVLPYNEPRIPRSKEEALADGYGSTEYVTLFNPDVVTQVTMGSGGAQMIATIDPRLAAPNLQTYPLLPLNTDPTRLEEIRRTLYIGNLDSTVPPDQVMNFFEEFGEVKYIRIAGDEHQATRFAFVEYTHQISLVNALPKNGAVLGSRALKINHSNNPIVKSLTKVDPHDPHRRIRDRSSSRDYGPRESKRRDRNRNRGHDRHRDRRLSPRDIRSRRSRSRDRNRDDESSSRTRRSRSREYRRSRSRDDIARRRSRSRDKKRRSRSRSIERRQKHRSRRH